MTYDLIVLGGGPAGYHAAERASISGLKTLLIEKQSLGGVCLNEGCIPTKVLLYSAKIYDLARFGLTYGVSCENTVLDHKAVIKRKDQVVRTLTAGVRSSLKKCGVTIIDGQGVIAGRTPDAYQVRVAAESYYSRNLLVATGSIPVVPPIPGITAGIKFRYRHYQPRTVDAGNHPGIIDNNRRRRDRNRNGFLLQFRAAKLPRRNA